MKIGHVDLNDDVFVIAEIGNNHEGDFDLAKEMIRSAAQAGVHAVKFQSIVPEKLVASSQVDRIAQLKRFQFSGDQFAELSKVAAKSGVVFMSTPFDVETVVYLDALVPAFKIASGDNDNVPLLRAVARTGKPIIMSTGLADLEQVRNSVAVIEEIWKQQGIDQDIALLHCVVSYPTAPEHAHLSAIGDLKGLGHWAGYSDHTIGVDAAVLSVALGARVIEKHFTIDKKHSEFRDHQLSADPNDMQELVERVRMAQVLIGAGDKHVQDCEKGNIGVRRSIFADRDMATGHVLTPGDLICLRSTEGIPSADFDRILDRPLLKPIKQGDILMAEHIA